MFTENWNKTGEMTAKMCFFFIMTVCIFYFIVTVCILSVYYRSTFPHGLELKTNNKNHNTAISNRNTYRIGTQVSWSYRIGR